MPILAATNRERRSLHEESTNLREAAAPAAILLVSGRAGFLHGNQSDARLKSRRRRWCCRSAVIASKPHAIPRNCRSPVPHKPFSLPEPPDPYETDSSMAGSTSTTAQEMCRKYTPPGRFLQTGTTGKLRCLQTLIPGLLHRGPSNSHGLPGTRQTRAGSSCDIGLVQVSARTTHR